MSTSDFDQPPSYPHFEQPPLTRYERLLQFHATLHLLTPRVFVTQAIVAANVTVFVVMAVMGVHSFMPASADLVRWGANYGPKTLDGQWWRLLSSMFLHIGLVHLLFNMWALWVVGRLVERLAGNVGFMLLYLISGIAGSLASVAWHPTIISAGASGAIFGVYGALFGFMVLRRDSVPAEILTEIRNSTLSFFLINLAFGFSVRGIDMAAHLGGAVAGVLCGMLLSRPLDLGAAARARLGRNLLLLLVGGGAIALAARLLPPAPGDFRGALERFPGVERRLIDAFNSTLKHFNDHRITGVQMADVIEREVLPPWRECLVQIESLAHLSRPETEFQSELVTYMRAREESWDLLARGLRQNDHQLNSQATAKSKEADAALERLSKMQPF